MEVRYGLEAEDELNALPPRERVSMLAAVEKLALLGGSAPGPAQQRCEGREFDAPGTPAPKRAQPVAGVLPTDW